MKFAVCLQKKSFTGNTGVSWTIRGVKPFTAEVEAGLWIKPQDVAGQGQGAIGFCAVVVVIWECARWTDDMGAIVEAWANGDLQLRSDTDGS